MTCSHVYWQVKPTTVERVILRARGRGRSRRTFEDVITEDVPGRSFWIADEAYRYCRERGISIKNAKMTFGSMSMH